MLHKSVTHLTIGAQSVDFTTGEDRQSIPCEQVIIAMGAEPDDTLLTSLSGTRAQLHRIGDCRRVGYIDGAILDARELVQAIG
ncbi:MAG: hypothetical protein R3E50_04210 [Halioglobus sp.]